MLKYRHFSSSIPANYLLKINITQVHLKKNTNPLQNINQAKKIIFSVSYQFPNDLIRHWYVCNFKNWMVLPGVVDTFNWPPHQMRTISFFQQYFQTIVHRSIKLFQKGLLNWNHPSCRSIENTPKIAPPIIFPQPPHVKRAKNFSLPETRSDVTRPWRQFSYCCWGNGSVWRHS